MRFSKNQPALLVGFWLVLVVIALFSRSYIPIDETRYVTVAWNMWLRGDYLVPWLNGAAYSHKPPLLFWLMNAGWVVFGVNDWWPRLVPSFFAIGSICLTARISRLLWPSDDQAARIAPLILLGSALWMFFTTATMFDMLTAFFALLGLFGIMTAWRGKFLKGWMIVGLAIGGGLLAKGPAVLLQILPAALLAPWWGKERDGLWRNWYLGLLGAVALGAAIALAWAIPAAMQGGEAYRKAIFWGQTADRMVHSFAHRRPFWWYLPMLPLMLFPWLFWVPVWRGFDRIRHGMMDVGMRFCLAWAIPAFLAFSFISGKQMHYLLPIFPAFALIVGHTLPPSGNGRWDQVPAAIGAVVMGALLLYIPHYAKLPHVAPWLQGIHPWAGICMIAAGVALVLADVRSVFAETWKMTLFGAATVVVTIYFAVLQSAGLAYDVRPLAVRLKALEDAGVPLAHAARYPGQYQFLGRLTKNPTILREAQLADWFKQHPDGKAVVYFGSRESLEEVKPDYQQPYLGEVVTILGKDSWPPHAQASEHKGDED